VAFSIVINAQLKSGYRFGINLTTMTIKTKGLSSKPETPIGIHFGGYYEIPVNRHFSIFSGFIFSSKGTDYEIDTIGISLTPTYIEIPVNFAYYLGSKATKISLFAGPYSACAIGGYKIVSGNEFKYLSFGAGKDRDLKYFDFGFNFGAGIKIKRYVISIQYGTGITNVSPANDLKMRNKVIGISITSLK
jgi:Outer membrane protein beta-barrel domain